MPVLLHVPEDRDIYVTEVSAGEVKRPPGDGWQMVAIIEGHNLIQWGPEVAHAVPPKFVWTRSKVHREMESEPGVKEGTKKKK